VIERYEWWVVAREGEVVCEQQMAGVRGCNVDAIVCGIGYLFGSNSPVIRYSYTFGRNPSDQMGVAWVPRG
jgi:hypothetical protein